MKSIRYYYIRIKMLLSGLKIRVGVGALILYGVSVASMTLWR